ncbi:hypothetical protein [Flavobacterium olei]|uniref:hypothetical protein n=1 Tax=Flavobacterium olei TaxID=1886782 RepID=UPI00321C0F2B
MKYELQLIISGKSEVKHGTIIQAAASYLRRSQSSSEMAKEFKYFKRQEAETLIRFITKTNFGFQTLIPIIMFLKEQSKKSI